MEFLFKNKFRKKISIKNIRKSLDKKTNYIVLYLQVVLQNDKATLSFFENLL
jgi:hypothetical protein